MRTKSLMVGKSKTKREYRIRSVKGVYTAAESAYESAIKHGDAQIEVVETTVRKFMVDRGSPDMRSFIAVEKALAKREV